MPCRSLLACAALAVLAGCTSAPAAPPEPPRPLRKPTADRTPERTPKPPAKPKPTPTDDGPVTLAFAGDVHFEEQLRAKLDDPDTALDPIAPALSDADLTMVNVETAIGTGGEPEDKNYTFQAPPTAFDALAAAGVDVVSMANNHGVDYGETGLRESLAAAEQSSLQVLGIGTDSERAFAPYVAEVRGTKVGFLAADAFPDPTTDNWPADEDSPGIAVAIDPERLERAVEELRESADVVVVYVHWGIERMACPTAEQSELARRLERAGADVIVGSHAHVLLGAGQRSSAFVAYGLGNFVWYGRNSEAEATTGVLKLTLDGREVDRMDWIPAKVLADGVPRVATGKRAEALRSEFAELRTCTDLSAVKGIP